VGGSKRRMGRLRNEKLLVLRSSLNVIRVIKWRRMKRAAHVICAGKDTCKRDFGGKISENKKTWKTSA
jgi:hypothetical protein